MSRKINVGQLFARCYRTLSEFLEFVLEVTSDHEDRILELEMRAGIRSGITTIQLPETDEEEENPF